MTDISIVIPIYRGKKYIKYWLEILQKNFENYKASYNLSCEAIFINDHPDEELRLDGDVSDIYIFNTDRNRGIHGARVLGYRKSKGNFIIFLDQDDKITEDYLVEQKNKIGASDAVVCNGYMERFCIRGKRTIYKDGQMEKVKSLDSYVREKNWIISPGQVLIRKDAIPDIWLKEVMKINGADDYFLWILMLKNECVFEVNKQYLYTHIEHSKNRSNELDGMYQSILEMISLLKRNDVLKEEELDGIQKKAFHRCFDDQRLKKIIKVYDQWMYLNIRGKRIAAYFRKYNYKRIAIYGMNYIGNRLYDELLGSPIEVIMGIDRAAGSMKYDIPIFPIEALVLPENIQRVDMVVVTAIDSYQEILCDMQKICDKPILSIEDIILELINELHEEMMT